MYKEVDDAINDSLSKLARVSRLSMKKLSISDIHVLDRSAAIQMQDKLVHALDHCEDKLLLIQNIRERSEYAHIVVPFMNYYAKKGVIPSVKRPSIISGSKVNKEYSSLSPFLLTGMMPEKLKLIGFENSENENIWFSCFEELKNGFIAMSNNGEMRKILDKNINDLGYTRIETSGKELRDYCLSTLRENFNNEAIKEVGFYLGKVTVPKGESDFAMRMLSKFIHESINNSRTLSPKRN